MTPTPEQIEKRAEVLYRKRFPAKFCGPWRLLTSTHKNRWRDAARRELKEAARGKDA